LDEPVGDQALEVREGGVELDAEAAPEAVEIDAGRLAEPGEAELATRLRGAEPLLGRHRRTAFANGREVALRETLVRPAPPGGGAQMPGVEPLRPPREPVRARGAVTRHALGRDPARLRLERHPGAAGDAEAAPARLEHCRDCRRRAEPRPPAAQVDTVRAPP